MGRRIVIALYVAAPARRGRGRACLAAVQSEWGERLAEREAASRIERTWTCKAFAMPRGRRW